MCVLRIENHGPDGVLVTVTTTLDVAATPRGRSRSVASYDEALSLVAGFLREYAAAENRALNENRDP